MNFKGFASPSIIDGTQSCQIQNDPSRLILSATATNGLLNVLNCTPTTSPSETTITLVDSTTYNVTASFSPFTPEQSYSCIAINDAGLSLVEITCEVLGNYIHHDSYYNYHEYIHYYYSFFLNRNSS